ncbi:seryl-tRNA synthetase [Clostridium acetobutylicum]|uniref:Serine--tRNA ligase 1 n=1 Tax=Clostridium acetobutylicum (strain ATCC 824 / DSM 792 / JCM 1419 / IAM 19013 / LMG 5710 / NBRC 13948 / NRRL B-527 / VKM B-1787 / 2291 / W) TaxID=272562 RepID=SYS1_CLOAB|nr:MULTISPECIES: serine--tRNA ligase [Clostridium]Q97N17.1 RecName: Full=Serine--tRNA ligase 1; AltName: Full=Seryl-tRNA synthetase 1; Short=SerRS 1; AltName: Full=Seryl-tRNA(Ser/Sec) synthetase 1 [Clostridium acetobutylicum ATCC 824]AAK78008.1 Seryl-tRNA synthetase (serine-tRNA ligase) [Clostridium acetobutylicum ATCC 824]ADZ19064.1 seryl-tRNA synthetase [Clostridium acetobutylicum EA 2018]AEI33580.1 seryl-tRNA synthetase [Clostridium acetobutylicum DSM 1731]AWV81929.1 serine--tRNA ligase [Cl
MLDLKRIRTNPEEIKKALTNRGEDFDISVIDELVSLDEERRKNLVEVENLKSKRNKDSGEIAKLKKSGQNADELLAEMKKISDDIKGIDAKVSEIDEKMQYIMLRIPNIPHPSVPEGKSDEENVEIRKWGEPRKFDFEFKAHWDIGTDLGLLDFERGGKVAGSRFTFYKGLGARLERAVINYFLDTHVEKHGYTEILPPYMVNRVSMTGTGQLPKFEEDAFKVDNGFFLIPTAEVPVTNMFRDEILKAEDLPYKFAAYSACFRSEAGSAGRDTRGLVRQHQFNKVELVKFAKPEESYDELEKLTHDAEEILQILNIPYRVVRICKGDLGFTAALKYDIEVWMPSYGRYVEISSCSNFEDFQARRANIKFRRDPKAKPEFVHTLNGSGLAVGRTVAAILENYQNEDGSVNVPEALKKYIGKDVIR